MSLRRIIREVHRRSLWQVLGIYVVTAWAVLQVVDVLAGNLALPTWTFPITVVLLLIGLPIVLATAFIQEGRGAGEGASGDGDAELRPGGRWLTWRNTLLGGVAALALVAVVAVGWHFFATSAAAGNGAALRSIAVLPFETRSGEEQDRYFAEGMHDDLLTQLAKIDSLTVISRTSVMQYADTRKSIRQIGVELGVAVVLEGGIQRAGDNVRINVQLIDANSDRHIWAETYDEKLTAANVFAIQSDLARKIAEALRGTLSPTAANRIDTRPTESIEAWDLYSRARYAFQHRGVFGEDLDETRALFEQAIARDSSFAAAWAGLGHVILAGVNWLRIPSDVGIPLASRYIERALALEPDNAEALASKARIHLSLGEAEEADRALLRAIELNPGKADLYVAHARVLRRLNRSEESIAAAQRGVELDPLNVTTRYSLADAYYYTSDFDGAIREAEKAVQMAPRDWYGHYSLGWAYAGASRIAPAVDALHKALTLTTDNASVVDVALAYAFAHGGQPDSARAYLQSVDIAIGGYDYALVLYELNERDHAFAALDTIARNSSESLRIMETDPAASAIRSDPRWKRTVMQYLHPGSSGNR